MNEEIRLAVLKHVLSDNYQAIKPSVLAKKLDIPPAEVPKFRRFIKRMVREGDLAFGDKHLIFSPMKPHPEAKKKEKLGKHVTGVFRRARAGFGFVRPHDAPVSADREHDVFIAAQNAGDAASGDIVRVKLSGKRGHKGKADGRIIDVVERQTNRFVGTYFEDGGRGLVQVDGKVFANPIYVGDPGAKGVNPDDKVVMELVRFPTHSRDGEGVLVKVLGQQGEPGVDTLTIVHEYGLPGHFPEEVLENAREEAEAFDEELPDYRKDMTEKTVLTIDPFDARDFDDAISLEQTENGHWLLGVHIADVSHFVKEKSALDQEARERATSVYLPDQVIPMIPEIISNNLASLQPDKVRFAMTAIIEFTAEGVRVATDVYKTAIKSDRRFTYEEVDEFLEDRKAWKSKLTPPVHALLSDMHTLAMTLRKRRFKRGSLELSLPEIKIDLDKKGRVCGAHSQTQTESHQIVEEFMLAANEAVAEMLSDQGLIFLRRVHPKPDPRKLTSLSDFVRGLEIKTESLESRFALQKLLSEVRGEPHERAVHYAALRAMQRAIYSPEDAGHYALASECYCHFTSPIRRYPDLTVHRLLFELIQKKKIVQNADRLFALGDHCSDREQRATQAERELNKMKLLNFLSDKIGMKLDGVITGVESFGIYVAGVELPAEGLVHVSALSDDHYKFERKSHTLSGFRTGNTYRLGDFVQVEVASVDVDRRELDFRMLGHTAKKKGASKRGKKEAHGRKKKKPKAKHQHSRKPGKKKRKKKK